MKRIEAYENEIAVKASDYLHRGKGKGILQLCGRNGMGKTLLARKYCKDHEALYFSFRNIDAAFAPKLFIPGCNNWQEFFSVVRSMKNRPAETERGLDMIKLFVTGDNHIGLKYASHENAATLASCRIEAFEKMVQVANQEDCDLFVITGDLFENTYSVSKRDILTLLTLLSRFQGTIVVLPGNHDYYDKDVKVWQYFKDVMASYDNIMLLTDYRPYEIDVNGEDVILYPALCTSLHSAPGQNNLGWIKNATIDHDGAYHIGIAHGAVEGETIDKEGQYFLMKRSELESIPVDAWLIGHTHVPFPRNLTETHSASERIFNAGTHVQTDVSCNTEGLCFIVEIADNKSVRAKKVVSGNLRFYRKHIEVSAGEMENAIANELKDIADNSVVDIILTGAVTSEEYEDRHKIIEAALARFIEGTYNEYSLNKLISKALIESEFPETSFSAGLLNSLLEEPKEAQLAYELLKSLKEGK